MLSERERRGPARRASTSFVGVLGWPLDYTLSPVVHSAAFRRLGMEWVYLAFPVPPEHLGGAVVGLRALGAAGANVTMPHKEAVVDFLDDVAEDARAVGAVNTIARVGDEFIGRNTDVEGFREFLSGDTGTRVDGRHAVVLGAGGAARAVVRALDELGAAQISVAARTRERAEPLAQLVSRSRIEVEGWTGADGLASTADIVVNTTPVGAPAGDPVPGAEFHKGQVVVDLIYDPPSTEMIEHARAAGADAWGGLGMLVRQAAASFRIWTGHDPPVEVMSAAAVRALGGRHPS